MNDKKGHNIVNEIMNNIVNNKKGHNIVNDSMNKIVNNIVNDMEQLCS